MAQNTYSYYSTQGRFDAGMQSYPHVPYPQQLSQLAQPEPSYTHGGQPYGQPAYPTQSNTLYSYDRATAPRSPLPPPPRSPIPTALLAGYHHPSHVQHSLHTPPQSHPEPQRPSTPVQPASSPIASMPARRPLPNPHARRADSLGAPTSVPPTAPSPRPRTPLHRPALSVPTLPSVNTNLGSPMSPQDPPPQSTTATVPPRPLPQPQTLPQPKPLPQLEAPSQPQPLPRSPAHSNLAQSVAQSASVVSESPKDSLPQIAPPGQKFVPHWRRALPAPGKPASAFASSGQQQQIPPAVRRGTFSGPASTPPPASDGSLRTVRPLPQSPGRPLPIRARSSSEHPLPQVPIVQAPLTQLTQSPPSSPPRMLPRPSIPSIRPLPLPNPVSSATAAAEADSSDDEDLSSQALLSRPPTRSEHNVSDVHGAVSDEQRHQYGILDLPSRIRSTPSNTSDMKSSTQSIAARISPLGIQEGQPAAPNSTIIRPGSRALPSPRPPSRTHGYSQSVPSVPIVNGARAQAAPPTTPITPDAGSPKWPSGLPPLPRAPLPSPAIGNTDGSAFRSMVDRALPSPSPRPRVLDLSLDDAPPPSLRRSPSPARAPTEVQCQQSNNSDRSVVSDTVNGSSNRGPSPSLIRIQIRGRAISQSNGSSSSAPNGARAPLPRRPGPPALPSHNANSPVSVTIPSSATSAFKPSAFPRPPSSTPSSHPLPAIPTVRSPAPNGNPFAVASPTSAGSGSSVFTLSSFPQPPARSRASEPIRQAADGGNKKEGARQPIPKISFPASADDNDSEDSDGGSGPIISISMPGDEAPVVSISVSGDDGPDIPSISVGDEADHAPAAPELSLPGARKRLANRGSPAGRVIYKGPGLICGGCGGSIVGRTVSAMGARWHPGCFRCCVCDELLENLSSYEHEGRAYCHFDYHELFAPKCYHCKTAIVDERFITLDDHELGKRTYHEQHFFCAECGDPFLSPKTYRNLSGELTFSGDGDFGGGDDMLRFTVYRGHPYCENCHVRLRLPKCKRCKKSIRDGQRAVEALGGKWCWECFVCASCEKPFEDPSFFQRDGKPFCENCFSIMIRNEV
ncbi:uncharacterized protein LAESUDRAFT_297246 [Laetiporus sulphureus 93-53]|uniref:LIM zinc-binding domain-containing protein n=1 Tax=Laetiporus sulphureus 93-53 TaxID=1314785 RepID=A0A165DBF0_9APHY|nr:uncharacterized protein LAESUDRAFT_297246 [Laetiporus sulphureus 93-53]KZT04483.1 hypothetical protein LAESUDRAFT_297246 [Laetiporus sulphureus 93-53]